MNLTDARGLPVSTQNEAAFELFERAVVETNGYFGNPLATLDEALAEDPDFGMVHALRADLAVMSTEQGALPLVQSSVDAIARLGNRANARERAHVGDFNLGDSQMLRDRPAQVMAQWNAGVPGYGYLLGMVAFGLEETGNYSRAEDTGRHALDLNPRDPWAVHAVQHVFEMQGRVHDGVEWLNATSANWADSALSFHNWWHLALHYLELEETGAALELYDRLIHPKESVVALELLDASQLLWRISLRNSDVGSRWKNLSDCWARLAEGGYYAFNDVHALMAYASAGREDLARHMVAMLERRAVDPDTNGQITREVGLPLARAIVAMAAGRPVEAAEWLMPVRSRASRIGGSHAQRDLVQLTCIEATLRGGNGKLARALDACGDAVGANAAREHAELRRRAQLRRNAA